MKVFTDAGEYFGDIEESILTQTKVFGWRVRATKNSFLSKVLGSAKGVIVPHQLVKSIGDIMIISKAAVPSYGPEGEEEK
jgi:sporulation protein YlmC with PRC-barrel domain